MNHVRTIPWSQWLSGCVTALLVLAAQAAGQTTVIITEIMYHPYQAAGLPEDKGLEFIELFNASNAAVDLTGWQLTDGVDFSFPSISLGAGAYLAVAADVNEFAIVHPNVPNVVGGWSGSLSNSGERIELSDKTGSVVDWVEYADEGDWSVRQRGPQDHGHRGWTWSDLHDGGGRSLELIDLLQPNEYGQNWTAGAAEGGSPGMVNSADSEDIAPFVLDIEHFPVVPAPGETITVSARVLDESPEGLSVRLHYRADISKSEDWSDPIEENLAGFQVVSLYDDGEHDDGQARDGVYAGEIPAQADGTIVEFFIEARDTDGNARTWPAPSLIDGTPGQVCNALFGVDATLSPYWTPGDQPIQYLVMLERERAELAYIGSHSDDARSNAQMNGTFINVDGTSASARYAVGIRNRGAGSRTTSNGSYRNNYRVNFRHDHPYKGVTALNIKNRYTHLQLLGSALWQMADLPTPVATAIQLRVNGQDLALQDAKMFGSYVEVEVVDSAFFREHFPEDSQGNAYQCTDDLADLSYHGTNADSYRVSYQKQTNVSADDYSDLIDLIYALNFTPPDNYVEDISQAINLNEWLRYLAVDALAGNLEGGLTTQAGDDYMLYSGVRDRRFWIIPHDLDTLFGMGDHAPDIERDIHVYAGVDGLHRLLSHPEIAAMYHRQCLDLIQTVFSPEQFEPLADEMLGGWVTETTIAEIKDFVRRRNAAVLAQIPQELQIDSAQPVLAGYHYTTSDLAFLSGTADSAKTRSVLVYGQPSTWSQTTGTWHSGGPAGGVADSLISQGATWSYLDNGSDQGTAWTAASFDDRTWPTGAAQLGYGDGDETTVVGYGPSRTSRYVTTYFRHAFAMSDEDPYAWLQLRLLRDDGAIVYLNGVEVVRSNMPDGLVNSLTEANSSVSGTEENTFLEFFIDPALLQTGVNVLAVEIHQASRSSSDVSFDLTLDAIRPSPNQERLKPGINRVPIKTYDGPDGTGRELSSDSIDIWYDTGSTNDYPQAATPQDANGAVLPDNTVWTPEEGPYRVTGELIVGAGRTLTIMPGTSIFFEPDARLVVHGLLIAEGQENALIRFTRTPGSADTWDGLQFIGTDEDNRITYAVIEYGRTDDGMVGVENSQLLLDYVTFDHTDLRRIRTIDSSLVVRNCVFTDIFAPDQPPTTDNRSEHIWGGGIPDGGQLLIENNFFGTTKGHNDAIDVDGPSRPHPIPQILNNRFMGGGDDALDLESDAHIEGNTFMNFLKDQYNTSPRESNVISAGAGKDYVVVRNVFYHCGHVAQIKDRAYMTFANNTVVDMKASAFYFEIPGQTNLPGRGVYVDSCIFDQVETIASDFRVDDPDWGTTDIMFNRSILPETWCAFGVGNIDADPLWVDGQSDFHLKAMSPAIGAGAGGFDMGAYVPAGASVAGVAGGVTYHTNVSLVVNGPGITDYVYSLAGPDGPWGAPRPIDTPIDLTDLQDDAAYQVYTLGKNSAGTWQASANASPAWLVDTSYQQLVISEVLAANVSVTGYGEALGDLVELHYDGPSPLDVSGMSLTDDPDQPAKFVFPSGTTMQPGEYLVLQADTDGTAPGIHLGFALDDQGGFVALYDRQGALVDSVEYGLQLPDLSIGRTGPDIHWGLTVPSFGYANVAAPVGDPAAAKINEWLARGEVLFTDDFVELFNPQSAPIDLGECYLTDNPAGRPDRFRFSPLTFIAGGGFVSLTADGQNRPGHVGLKLSADGELLSLLDPYMNEIDQIIYAPQTVDFSQGRSPNGSSSLEFFPLPTPNLANPASIVSTEVQNLVAFDSSWSYEQSGTPLPASWSDPTYSTTSWPTGAGVLYVESSSLPIEKNTSLTLGSTTYYFRTHFTLDADPGSITSLELTTLIDDGAVVYLNGHEVLRLGMPSGSIDYNTWAARTVGNADLEGPFALDTDFLQQGDNLLAIEVHQTGATSSDIVMGAKLDGVATTYSDDHSLDNALALLDGLRITELMYHAPEGAPCDYVELQNVADVTVDLTGVRFTDGIDFVFGHLLLAPGQFTVVAADETAFVSCYGSDILLAGQYEGNLSNSGEHLVLSLPEPLDAAILRFAYSDTWYDSTDGAGDALVVPNPTLPAFLWNEPGIWQAGAPTPGQSE